jgi:hypothetical protein
LEDAIRKAADRRSCENIEHVQLPIDFAADPDYSKSFIARFG